jgi:hypothetical protein
MVDPVKSQYDLNPYVPPPDPPPGLSAVAGPPPQPPPGYAAAPALSMAWTAVPNITGDIPGQQAGSGSPPKAAEHGPISVSLPSIRNADEGMLSIAETLVAGYNSLRAKVLEADTTPGFWGEDATYDTDPNLAVQPSLGGEAGVGGNPNPPDMSLYMNIPDAAIQNAAHQFDQVIGPLMSRALRTAGDSFTAGVGCLAEVVNLVGQMYASADKSSYFPPPGQAQDGDTSADQENGRSAQQILGTLQ